MKESIKDNLVLVYKLLNINWYQLLDIREADGNFGNKFSTKKKITKKKIKLNSSILRFWSMKPHNFSKCK